MEIIMILLGLLSVIFILACAAANETGLYILFGIFVIAIVAYLNKIDWF